MFSLRACSTATELRAKFSVSLGWPLPWLAFIQASPTGDDCVFKVYLLSISCNFLRVFIPLKEFHPSLVSIGSTLNVVNNLFKLSLFIFILFKCAL